MNTKQRYEIAKSYYWRALKCGVQKDAEFSEVKFALFEWLDTDESIGQTFNYFLRLVPQHNHGIKVFANRWPEFMRAAQAQARDAQERAVRRQQALAWLS